MPQREHIPSLQHRVNDAVGRLKALVAKADEGDRNFTAEETGAFAEIEQEVKDLKGRLERALATERAAAAGILTNAVTGERILGTGAGGILGNVPRGGPTLGMPARDRTRYSLLRAVIAAAKADWHGAELEQEMSSAVAEHVGVPPRGFYVPGDILVPRQTAASLMTVDTGTGGELVRTDLMTDAFIEYLAKRLVIRAAGARVLEGLSGNVDIPKKTAPASVGWVAEDGSTSATGFTTGSVQLRPKTVNGATTISRLMQLQTSRGIEALVRDDLLAVVLGAIDLGALHGTGQNNQPKGVILQTDVGVVECGAAGDYPTWQDILDLEREVAIDNADLGGLAYITNAKVRSKLKGTAKESGYPLYVWGDGPSPLNGYPAFVTNNVKSDLTKDTGTALSAIFYGNWQDLLIGLWGGLDVIANPFNADGSISVYVFQTCDVQVRHGESFAVIKDAKTS